MPSYPEGLLDWSGNRAGGVKKLFYGGSGRPAGQVIRTELLDRLSEWAGKVAQFQGGTPNAVLLLGGPGNGKTEAVEHTLREIDSSLAMSGALVNELGRIFSSQDGSTPGRLVEVDLSALSDGRLSGILAIVQDASEGNPGSSKTPAELLCEDLARLLFDDQEKRIYLACVNRGVLDDALILSAERGTPRQVAC
ncbi:hypothetical protein [Arenimonas daejeonensis]|uniref:hypothetical protein n=1 Tax=Arenimonas daejeonensis TaxID=370777 RepID=UPI0011BFD9A7|nr:hypothetical protein [Arenimonas daejeonensis]